MIDEILKRLKYDPLTGYFTWLTMPENLVENTRLYKAWKSRCLGKRAGHVYKKKKDKTSYRSITFKKMQLKEHQLAFLFQTGKWPDGIVDHIDGNGTNNVWQNLRIVSAYASAKNRPKIISNTSGIMGVCYIKKRDKWQVRIGNLGKSVDLGVFEDFFEACCKRKSAEILYQYHENYGRILER